MLKTSEFSRVRRTSENSDIFNSRDEIYLVFTEKSKFSFYFIRSIGYMQYLPTEQGGGENAKTKNFSKPK